ncbi:MAG: hypothetical protein IJ761_07800 [Bacteroidales bacterium]|nr:hypothetical protein [Bacteroidales bacterium]
MRLHKRIAPLVLLAAYLPLLIVLSLHTHHESAPTTQTCIDCAHHVSHSKHMQEASATTHLCVVCQIISSLHYFAPQDTDIINVEQCHTIEMQQKTAVVVEARLYSRFRAPPIC